MKVYMTFNTNIWDICGGKFCKKSGKSVLGPFVAVGEHSAENTDGFC